MVRFGKVGRASVRRGLARCGPVSCGVARFAMVWFLFMMIRMLRTAFDMIVILSGCTENC